MPKNLKSDWAHQWYIKAQDACLSLLETALNNCSDDSTCVTIIQNLLSIAPAVKLLHDSYGEQERAAAKARYWEEHAAEKASLEQEQDQLEGQLRQLTDERETLPQRAECARIPPVSRRILSLSRQNVSGPGRFDIS